MQRFGTTSLPTYEVGKVILKKNWKKAVDLILMEKKGGMILLKYFYYYYIYIYQYILYKKFFDIHKIYRKRKSKKSEENMERNTRSKTSLRRNAKKLYS